MKVSGAAESLDLVEQLAAAGGPLAVARGRVVQDRGPAPTRRRCVSPSSPRATGSGLRAASSSTRTGATTCGGCSSSWTAAPGRASWKWRTAPTWRSPGPCGGRWTTSARSRLRSAAGLRLHPLAAPALSDLAERATLTADAAWRDRLGKWREAQAGEPETPGTLRGELRPYQVDGFRWLARLADLGAGACSGGRHGPGEDRAGARAPPAPRSGWAGARRGSDIRRGQLARRGAPLRPDIERRHVRWTGRRQDAAPGGPGRLRPRPCDVWRPAGRCREAGGGRMEHGRARRGAGRSRTRPRSAPAPPAG